MKPNIFRICKNYECSQYDKKVVLEKGDEKWSDDSPFCSECHKQSEIEYSHKGIEAKDRNSFYAIVSGMAKEFHLLKRMIDKGVAEPEDKNRYEEILSKIDGLDCTGCGQQFIHHEHK